MNRCLREGCPGRLGPQKRSNGEDYCSTPCEWVAGLLDHYATPDTHANLWAAVATLGDALSDLRQEQQRDQRRRNRRKRRSASRVK